MWVREVVRGCKNSKWVVDCRIVGLWIVGFRVEDCRIVGNKIVLLVREGRKQMDTVACFKTWF